MGNRGGPGKGRVPYGPQSHRGRNVRRGTDRCAHEGSKIYHHGVGEKQRGAGRRDVAKGGASGELKSSSI